jgi:hypothetical protein
MTIGGALFLIAVGAILRYAVSDRVEAVNLGIVGLILIAVGLIGLVLGLFAEMNRRRSPHDPVL